jgi:carbamate kinase
VREDEDGFRRIVPSPVPLDIVERQEIAELIERGTIVIAAGGGGTPVYRDPVLKLEGIDAVIDKDRAAAVLAQAIKADVLLILSNVEGVYRGYGSDQEALLSKLRVDEAEALLRTDELGQGSMAPKVEAALSFVRAGGSKAIIARLDQGLEALNGQAGTTIEN